MNRVDLHTATTFLKLRSPGFAAVVAHLKACRQDAQEVMSQTPHEDVWRTMQGRAALAAELVDLIENGEALAAKLARR